MDTAQLFSPEDHRYMAETLKLARKGEFSTQPNPHVGCLIVKHRKIIGRGYHLKAGEAHAEVNALAEAGKDARGATCYVNLEPCSHTGRTPPCADQLIAAGISRVVFAVSDDNPRVAGTGSERLRNAGIEVNSGLLECDARQLNRGFFQRHNLGRPFVTLKVAMSLDAKIGLTSGESKWITGEDARADVQRLRARSCAIVTGSGTVRADDPRLTVRDKSLALHGRQPHIVVLDTNLRLNANHQVFNSDANCIVIYQTDSTARLDELARKGVQLRQFDGQSGQVDLADTLAYLASIECNEILVEAGPTLIGSFIAEALWDELVLYVAPKAIGRSGRDGFDLPSIPSLDLATQMRISEVTQVGDDIRITLAPKE